MVSADVVADTFQTEYNLVVCVFLCCEIAVLLLASVPFQSGVPRRQPHRRQA